MSQHIRCLLRWIRSLFAKDCQAEGQSGSLIGTCEAANRYANVSSAMSCTSLCTESFSSVFTRRMIISVRTMITDLASPQHFGRLTGFPDNSSWSVGESPTHSSRRFRKSIWTSSRAAVGSPPTLTLLSSDGSVGDHPPGTHKMVRNRSWERASGSSHQPKIMTRKIGEHWPYTALRHFGTYRASRWGESAAFGELFNI